MPATNPGLEQLRQQSQQLFNKERDTRREEAQHLLQECVQTQLPWMDLPCHIQQRICRSIDTADEARGYAALANLFSVDPTDAAFYQKQSGGLQGPTELLLEDQLHRWQRQRRTLPAALPLQVLLHAGVLRCLSDVRSGVQGALASRRQTTLLWRSSSGDDTQQSLCSMESGYDGSVATDESTSEIVGVVQGSGGGNLVKAVPVKTEPGTSPTLRFQNIPKLDAVEKQKVGSGPRLMLTYAADGRDAAFQVADLLKERQLRVMLLEEQRRWRQPDPYTAVQKWFKQVDYIVALLTPEYLAATQNRAQPTAAHARRLAEDARFVYSLMCAEMEQNGHVNWRVRSLVPDAEEDAVRQHPVYGSPLFRWPFLVSELDELTECLGAK